jgi:two-component system cell cycle sensor histidine kinase/response regulator CckA
MQSPSVLIVEDEQIVAMDLSATLRRLGYTVPATASSGDEAIQQAAQHHPDLVLMDICLSGPMDGIEATERIHTDLDVPIVYLTAHTDQDTQRRARHTAPYGYLVKPFDERTLQTTIDMTIERHERDRQTRVNEQRLLTTLASIGDAVLIADAMGRISFLNPIAEHMLRYPATLMIGHPVDHMMRLIDAVSRVPIEHPVRAALRSDEHVLVSMETILIAHDGSELCIDHSAAPIRAVGGQLEGVVMLFRDATIRRRLGEAKQYDRLRVLAGGIAHDLNNMLAIVINNAKFAQLDLDGYTPTRATLEAIEAAAYRAAHLTRHLLAYAGRTHIVLEPMCLNTLADETIQLLSSGPLKHVTIHTNLWADLPRIEADTAQLQQVVQNLLINAAEAIGTQSGTITVTTALRHLSAAELATATIGTELRSGPYLALEITDTGCGMDAETYRHIFEPDFTTKPTGHGIGLAAVQGIIREHRGAIMIASAPDQGTTFTIYLPYVPVGDITFDPPAVPSTGGHIFGTVLVIDDEIGVRSTLVRLLERLGFKVLTAADGSAGIEIVRNRLHDIDCVLLDLTIPGMPSAVAARTIRQLHPMLPIVLMSGYSLEDMAQSLQEAAGMQFLPKPFRPAELMSVLQRVFTSALSSFEMGR